LLRSPGDARLRSSLRAPKEIIMALDTWFAWANQLAAPGWVCLIVGLLAGGADAHHTTVRRVARAALFLGGRLIPVLLALGYAAAIWRWFGSAQGDFASLRGVERLFETRGMVLAGWLHFLAFDLWVGRWQIDRMALSLRDAPNAATRWLWRLAVVPCLLCTFMFGPVGLLLFLGLIALRDRATGGSPAPSPAR
jgi:hypothetical protein